MSSNHGRNFLQHALYRIVGARGTASSQPLGTHSSSGDATPTTSFPRHSGSYLCCSHNQKPRNFGQFYTVSDIAKHRLVYFGEIHSVPQITAFEQSVAAEMQAQSTQTLHIVMEHFSFDMQGLLDDYQANRISFDELVKRYDKIGTEQHDLKPYKALLEYARRDSDFVQLHAGFLSRNFARMLMKEGERAALESAMAWLPVNTTSLRGNDFHYSQFERLICGTRPLVASGDDDEASAPLSDRFRGIFQAQLLKDYAMAHYVQSLLDESHDRGDKILVIAGNGHLQYGCGVPERVTSLAAETCLVLSLPVASTDDKDTLVHKLCRMYGREGSNPADFIFAYSEESGSIGNDHDVAAKC